MAYFSCLDIRHIYREHDQRANGLSKEALVLAPSVGKFSEFLDGNIDISRFFQLF